MTTKTRTTYTTLTPTTEETFSTKQAAVRFGEKTGEEFYVRTSGGAIVHDTREDGASHPEDPAEPETTSEDEQTPVTVLSYRTVGPKHFYKALTSHPLLVPRKDFTVLVPTVDAARVTNAWGDALDALRAWKKENGSFKRQSTKTDDGRKLRYEMEQEFLSEFVKKALR